MMQKLTRHSLHFFRSNGRRYAIKRNLINLTVGRPYSSKEPVNKKVDRHMMLPIGFDNFQEVIEGNLGFVDKTLFIKEILDDKATKAALIIRPRRFGKTMNLSMLHHFLADRVYGKETKNLFQNLKIAEYPQYMQNQGKYPVVLVSFKDVKESNYESAYKTLSKLMSDVYLNYRELSSSQKLDEQQKQNFQMVVQKKAGEAELKSALKDLVHYLYLHYEIKPWLLIDEYDTPIQAGYAGDYYKEMINLMRGVFSAAIKTNPYLEKAVITGILRVAKESLFSGVNNLEVYSLLRSEYGEFFGFTEQEVDALMKQSNLFEKSGEIKDWYNGYNVGQVAIYNPWSIANCIKQNGQTKPYWINTSDNQLIKDLLKESSLEFKTQFEHLMRGETTEQLIDENMVFTDLEKNPAAIWSLLLMSGYLTPDSSKETDQGTLCKLTIPNKEVRNLYRQIVEQWFSNGRGVGWYNVFIASLLGGEINVFKGHLDKVLLQIVSYHDLAKEPEAFFHGLLLGFIASLQDQYEIKSNRESGFGRFDIILIPRDKTKNEAGVVIELKVKKEGETLKEAAKKALLQIEQKKYVEEFTQRGIEKVIRIGVGFKGKECEVEGVLNGFSQIPKNSI